MSEKLPVHQLGNAPEHACYLYDDMSASCSCGANWTYPKSSTMEHMRSIYESHLKYFNRPKTVTL